MSKIIRAIVLLIILSAVSNYLNSHYSPYAPLSFLLLFFGIIYFIVTIIRYAIDRKKMNAARLVTTPAKQKNNGALLWLLLIVITFAVIIAFRRPLGLYSFRVFAFTDHLTKISHSSAIPGWALLGLFIGFVYGSFVAWKKYRLNFPVNFLSIGLLLLLVTVFFLVNDPLGSNAFSRITKTQTAYAYRLMNVADKSDEPARNTFSSVANIADSSDYTAWIKETKKRTGDKIIEFTFSATATEARKNVRCTGLMVKNGNRRSEELWHNNSRIKNISILKNGTLIRDVTLADSNEGAETVAINPIAIQAFDRISIKINSVYPGKKFPKKTAVTEFVPILQWEEEY